MRRGLLLLRLKTIQDLKAIFSQSIHLKLTLFVALLVTLTGFALSWAGYLFARDTLYQQINDKLSVIAFDRQTFLRSNIRQQQDIIAQIASRTMLRKHLENFLSGKASKTEFLQETITILKDAKEGTSGLSEILILDQQGKVLTASNPVLIGQDWSYHPDFKPGLTKSHFGLPHMINGKLQSYLTTPITSTHNPNKQLGAVMVLLDIEPMLMTLRHTMGLGETGEVVVGGKGRYLSFPTNWNPIRQVFPWRLPSMVSKVLPGGWIIN
jgi:C4-dicarboxylate-specific signal transduction histidine kinase